LPFRLQRELAGIRPFHGVREEPRGMHLIEQRFAMLEDGKVVLAEGLGDDFWEQVEVGLADHLKVGRQVNGVAQTSAHVDVAGVEVLDHEHSAVRLLATP